MLGTVQIKHKDNPYLFIYIFFFLLAEAQCTSIDFRCIRKEGPDPKLTEVNQSLFLLI